MKKFLVIPLIVLFARSTSAQIFQGSITYNNTYVSKLPNITDKQWGTMVGTIQEYFIKDGDYKSVTNGTYVSWQLYIQSENKIYTRMGASGSVIWRAGDKNDDMVLKSELKPSAAQLMGYLCDELTLTWKSGIQKYYFSPRLGVDTKLYSKHLFGNWYAYLSKANALPIKSIIETPQFIMTSTATAIKPGRLDDSIFRLPAGAKAEEAIK